MDISLKVFSFVTFIIPLLYGQQFQCPLNEDLQPINGTFADPVYCNVYHHCVNGNPFPQQCPPGLFFTVKLKNCRYSLCVDPSQAKCPGETPVIINSPQHHQSAVHKNDIKKRSRDIHQPKNEFICDPNIDGTFPNPKDCRQYYHCVAGVSWPQQCPSDFAFNPQLNVRNCNIQVCVPLSEAFCAIDGGWSEWSTFGNCFPTCGNGLKARTRECNNPPPSNGGAGCLGNNVDAVECNQEDCPVLGSPSPAFFVGNRRPISLRNKHTFDKVVVNSENLYDSSDSSMNITKLGLYFTAFVYTSKSEYRGRGRRTPLHTEFWRSGTRTGETTDQIQSLYRYSSFVNPIFRSIQSSRGLAHGSETGLETAWLGFRYEAESALFALRSGTVSSSSVVPFTRFYTREDITGSSLFTINTAGYYYITFNYAVRRSCNVALRKNSNILTHMNMLTTKSGSFLDMKSKAAIVHFADGDQFSILRQSGEIFADGDKQIGLVAIRLNGTNDSPLVSVERTTEFNSTTLDTLAFNNVIYDVGNGWDPINHNFICRVPGIYMISLAIGNKPFSQMIAEITVNNEVQGRLMYLISDSNHGYSSRSLLVKLKEADVVKVNARGTIGVFSTTSLLNIFYVSS